MIKDGIFELPVNENLKESPRFQPRYQNCLRLHMLIVGIVVIAASAIVEGKTKHTERKQNFMLESCTSMDRLDSGQGGSTRRIEQQQQEEKINEKFAIRRKRENSVTPSKDFIDGFQFCYLGL